jgi:ABC-2 type transport system permease protein
MRNIFVIAERDFKTYFASPIAYVVLAIFVFLSGLFFNFFLGVMVQQASSMAMRSAQTGQPPQPMDVPGLISQNFFNWISFIMLFLLPMITMALFSEEKKRGTIELLLTAPITDLQVVLGKFFAAAAFYVVLLITTALEMAILWMYSTPAPGPILTAYLGILLYGLAVLAIGMFISTLTENQIVAAVITFGTLLMFWLIDVFARGAGETLRAVLGYLSILDHLNDFLMGVVTTSHLIFYLSLILIGLFLTYRSLDSLRWRS